MGRRKQGKNYNKKKHSILKERFAILFKAFEIVLLFT